MPLKKTHSSRKNFPVVVSGRVKKGLGGATKLGFPTMNISPRGLPKPFAFGIYAAVVQTPIGFFAGAFYYGPRFAHDQKISCEVHCIGMEKNLYGKKITISIKKFLRAPKKFKTHAALIKGIKKDITSAKKAVQ